MSYWICVKDHVFSPNPGENAGWKRGEIYVGPQPMMKKKDGSEVPHPYWREAEEHERDNLNSKTIKAG